MFDLDGKDDENIPDPPEDNEDEGISLLGIGAPICVCKHEHYLCCEALICMQCALGRNFS